MSSVDSEGHKEEPPSFELSDEPEQPLPGSPPPVKRERASPAPSQRAKRRASAEPTTRRDRGGEKEHPDAQEGLLDDRRRKRLLVYGPVICLLYLLLGWFFAGAGLGWFTLAGLGVGVFAAWRRRGEVLLGSVAAVAGFSACLVAVGRPLLFVIVGTGLIGYIAGIDDRLRNS